MGGEVKNMRRALLAASAFVVLAGCASPGPVAAGNYKLYEAAAPAAKGQIVAVIDTHSRTTERRLPWGIPSTDGKHFYSVSRQSLQDIDPRSGAALRTLELPGFYEMPPATLSGIPGGLSQNGRYLVLQTAGQRTSSHMLLIDTKQFSVAKRIDLEGKFDFDAVNNNGQSIYVIEYPNPADSYYHVRVYDVSLGRLAIGSVVDKAEPNEVMTGVRLSGVFSPDGQWLYSIYTRDKKGAFVHALNLNQPFAVCLDLPGSGYSASMNGFDWSIAITPDGRHLYAANGPMGLVTEIDNRDGARPSIVRTGKIESAGSTASVFVRDVAAKEMGRHAAVVSKDGNTLVTAGAKGLIWIDTGSLQVRNRALADWRVQSLAASPDGARIYALNDAGAIAELSMASAAVVATFDPGEGYPMGLLRVEPA
jgi:hypothetical protein